MKLVDLLIKTSEKEIEEFIDKNYDLVVEKEIYSTSKGNYEIELTLGEFWEYFSKEL